MGTRPEDSNIEVGNIANPVSMVDLQTGYMLERAHMFIIRHSAWFVALGGVVVLTWAMGLGLKVAYPPEAVLGLDGITYVRQHPVARIGDVIMGLSVFCTSFVGIAAALEGGRVLSVLLDSLRRPPTDE